jgi:uncharacterized membrane-anchored protein YhcB (DUF1043 family)
MTTHIDTMITEANLRSVQVFDINEHMDKKWDDLNNLQKIVRRHNLTSDQASKELEKEYNDLKEQMEDWRSELGINRSNLARFRMVMLVEEIKKT